MPHQLELELAGDLRGRDELHKTVDVGELAGDCPHLRVRHETKSHAYCSICGARMHRDRGDWRAAPDRDLIAISSDHPDEVSKRGAPVSMRVARGSQRGGP